MFKKSIAVLLTLICVSCVNAYAKQSDADKLKTVDAKIAEYTQKRNTGRTMFWCGLGASLLAVATWPTATIETTYTKETLYGVTYDIPHSTVKEPDLTLNYVLWLGGAIVGIWGAYDWYDGAAGIKVWESKRLDVSMGLLSSPSIALKKVTEIGITARF